MTKLQKQKLNKYLTIICIMLSVFLVSISIIWFTELSVLIIKILGVLILTTIGIGLIFIFIVKEILDYKIRGILTEIAYKIYKKPSYLCDKYDDYKKEEINEIIKINLSNFMLEMFRWLIYD